jgi:hypothetical protein
MGVVFGFKAPVQECLRAIRCYSVRLLLGYNRYLRRCSLALMTLGDFAWKPIDGSSHLLTLVAG